MVIMVLQRVTPALRGELTRWLIQIHTGVFIGTLSSRVRQKLWQRVCTSLKNGAALMAYPCPTEQGFTIETNGHTKKAIEDFEGLLLAKTRLKG